MSTDERNHFLARFFLRHAEGKFRLRHGVLKPRLPTSLFSVATVMKINIGGLGYMALKTHLGEVVLNPFARLPRVHAESELKRHTHKSTRVEYSVQRDRGVQVQLSQIHIPSVDHLNQ